VRHRWRVPLVSRRRPPGDATVAILEWRPTGHRLAYVAAIAGAVADTGRAAVLVTTQEVLDSPEYQVHLAALVGTGLIEVRRDERLVGRAGVVEVLCGQTTGAVVPEVDDLLPPLAVAAVTGRLPRSTAVIVMRPPRRRGWSVRTLLVDTGKVAAIMVLAASRRVDVHLLEDPLAHGRDRVWPWPLNRPGLRLDDPCDLAGTVEGELDDAVDQALRSSPAIAVVGRIDQRKRLPLVLDAWSRRDPSLDGSLLVLGAQTEAVQGFLAERPAPPGVVTLDRYLENPELLAVVRRCRALVVLYDGGLSSGVIVTAAAAGTPVIVGEGTRTGRIAAHHGFGVVTSLEPEAVARTIEAVLARSDRPNPVPCATARDFGQRVLRTFPPPGRTAGPR
jgi:glycosyltransferase involved in cell wall biosynthesis